ncbi:unnamed protein product [Camellia sinensis]
MENRVDINDEEEVLHIVMFPWLAMGHLIPFLHLSTTLATKGHRISFISTDGNLRRLPQIPLRLSPLITFILLPFPAIPNLPPNAESSMDAPHHQAQLLKIAFDFLKQPLSDFLEKISPNPDWIISDYTSHWLSGLAAEMGVSCAFFSLFNAATMVFFGPPAKVLSGDCVRSSAEDFQSERPRTKGLDTSELLEQLPALQQLLFRVLGCQPQEQRFVASESIKIYNAISDGVVNLVDKFFEMQRHDALKALDIYQRSGKQSLVLIMEHLFEDQPTIENSNEASTSDQSKYDQEMGSNATPRNSLRKVLAEAMGTFILMFCICAIIAITQLMGGQVGLLEYAATAALTVVVVIFSIGAISGAHVNPSITFALATLGQFPRSQVVLAEAMRTFILMFCICAIIAITQLMGGQVGLLEYVATAALTVVVVIFSIGAISGAHVNPSITFAFATLGQFPRSQVLAEAMRTFILMFCICAIIAITQLMGGQVGLLEYAATAALTVVVVIFSIGAISGAHVNPSITFAFATLGQFPRSQVLAEAMGTFILMFCICAIIAITQLMGGQVGLLEYAATAALTVVVVIFSIGAISGAHVNPSITFAFATLGQFPRSQVLAEAMGTFILMFCICAIIAITQLMGGQVGLLEYAATSALTVVVVIFSIGAISGAHVNPSITFAFATLGQFPWSQVPLYIIAQIMGSTLATYVGSLVYGIKSELMITRPLQGSTTAFWVELIATFIIMFLASSLEYQSKYVGHLSGFIVGTAIGLAVLISGPISGGSMNPARSLGPAIVSWKFGDVWIYLIAPTVGAVGGALLFRALRLQHHPCCSDSSPNSTRLRQPLH